MKEKIYSAVFLISLAIFILNFMLQGPISFGYSDDFGLITKLSPVFWVGYLGMIVIIYYHYTNFGDIREVFVLLTLFLVTVYLIGTPFFYEILPRFEDSWFHSHLAEKIYETGKVRSTGNIYEQYPGSFLFYGLSFNFLPVYTFMKMFTILFYLFGVSVVYLIFKELDSPKTALLVTILYMFFSWTAEDNHISPQFLMINLYIVFIFLLVKLMKTPDEWRMYGFLLLTLILVFSFSHLFTQIFVFSTLGAFFVLVPKTRKLILPIFIFAIVLFVIHETVFTEIFGTFRKDLMESIRNFSLSSFLSSPSERIGTEGISRKIFIWSRLTILGTSMILGLSGIVTMYLKGSKTEAKLLLAWSYVKIL
ncbi:MAG: hypothetical protein GF368_04495 [Candidatus Aenigmarchaeota archaeon]|nr:hypothetical protein [Candidatus Aenigmarchaeota archaeon]